eukprot:scpid82244/ scgid23233/ 
MAPRRANLWAPFFSTSSQATLIDPLSASIETMDWPLSRTPAHRLQTASDKKLTEIFKRFDLKITIEANLKVVDFLDVTMNLDTGKFQPFRKPNDNPLYVSKQSNHPPGITNNIPAAVNKRLSAISSDAEAFNHAAPVYQTALKASGYTEVLSFQPEAHEHRGRKNRSRKVIIMVQPPLLQERQHKRRW